MTWTCPICQNELGELNGYCEYCKVKSSIIVYNPDKYFIREICIEHIEGYVMSKEGLSGEELLAEIEANTRMTPQEKLHARFFYHETILVKDMDRLTLRAHIEDLSKIAFEARSRHGAAVNEDKRRDKSSDQKGQGFSRSLNIDEVTSDAINAIKERQKKLTGKEKMLAGIVDLYVKGGMTRTEAEALATSKMTS